MFILSSGEVGGRNAGALGFAAADMNTWLTYTPVQRKERSGGKRGEKD